MVSRIFVRSVLVVIMALMVWFGDLTWSRLPDANIAQRVFLTIIEGAVLSAALSLLFESLRSFGTFTVNGDSYWYIFSGLSLVVDDSKTMENGVVTTTRTCALFYARSFILSFSAVLVCIIGGALHVIVSSLLLFLFDPHIPVIPWEQVSKDAVIATLFLSVAGMFFWGACRIEKKLSGGNTIVKTTLMVLYFCICLGIMFGFLGYIDGPPVLRQTLLMSILMTTGVVMSFAGSVGAIFALGFGLYKLAGKAIARFPILRNAWNTLCPVQTIHIVK